MGHYLCERCGGTGVCSDCDGGGLLGPARGPDPAAADMTYGEKALGCFVALAAVLSVAVTLLILGDYVIKAIRANGPAEWLK